MRLSRNLIFKIKCAVLLLKRFSYICKNDIPVPIKVINWFATSFWKVYMLLLVPSSEPQLAWKAIFILYLRNYLWINTLFTCINACEMHRWFSRVIQNMCAILSGHGGNCMWFEHKLMLAIESNATHQSDVYKDIDLFNYRPFSKPPGQEEIAISTCLFTWTSTAWVWTPFSL